MNKIRYIFCLLIISLTSCVKDNDDNFILTKEYLIGDWKMISFKNTDLISGDITEFDLSECEHPATINIDSTGLAIYNTPCLLCIDDPCTNMEAQDQYKVIDNVLHVQSILINGVASFVPVKNAFDKDGLFYLRWEDYPINSNEPTTLHIRIFKKMN